MQIDLFSSHFKNKSETKMSVNSNIESWSIEIVLKYEPLKKSRSSRLIRNDSFTGN